MKSLLKNVQELKNINALEKKIQERGIEWLNKLYILIGKMKDAVDYVRNNQVSIFPNQNGCFCALNKLSVDLDVDDAYKDVLNSVQNDCRDEFLDKEIIALDWMYLPECSIQDVFTKIKNELLQRPKQLEKVYEQLVVLNAKGDMASDISKKQIEILEFANVVFPGKFVVNHEVSIVSEELLEESIKYLCVKIVDEISRYGDLETLDLVVSYSEEGIEKWVAEFIDFINLNSALNYNEGLKPLELAHSKKHIVIKIITMTCFKCP